MKVIDLLQQRKENWNQLEHYCRMMEKRNHGKLGAVSLARFAALYRATCADLALAASYQLPPTTVNYLHRLVGRAHNQLYRSKKFQFRLWIAILLFDIPRRLYHDKYLKLATLLFWGSFIFAMWLSSNYSPIPSFAADFVGESTLKSAKDSYSETEFNREFSEASFMVGYYINNNTGIGLMVFAGGLLFGVGGIPTTLFNGLYLGAIFGYISTTSSSDNFYHFVCAHGPFELTAIVLSAAAGMRLGFALVSTNGLGRIDSLRRAAQAAMPIMGMAMILFFLAAMIEGFISPSSLPFWVKAAVSAGSSGLLMLYIVLLGQAQPEVTSSAT